MLPALCAVDAVVLDANTVTVVSGADVDVSVAVAVVAVLSHSFTQRRINYSDRITTKDWFPPKLNLVLTEIMFDVNANKIFINGN